ncbi:MAG: Mut7-C RNAse domain-containing protein [Candidatus Eisenbacteria sp.]|nr:Mut7-C RNAse domain-containing protein [Candidatus Eisenbacteria bacterium]
MAETDDRPAFIADAMLGRLARALRMLGLDTFYRPDIDDNELKMTALREGRAILTRDHEVADTNLPVTVLLIESDHVEEQLLQTARAFRIAPGGRLFSRCLICNVEVEDVEKCEVRERVPEYVYETQERFSRCPSCGRVYWPATHVERARKWIAEVLGANALEDADGNS